MFSAFPQVATIPPDNPRSRNDGVKKIEESLEQLHQRRLKAVIKRNAKDKDGMFVLSLHDEYGGLAQVQHINSEALPSPLRSASSSPQESHRWRGQESHRGAAYCVRRESSALGTRRAIAVALAWM